LLLLLLLLLLLFAATAIPVIIPIAAIVETPMTIHQNLERPQNLSEPATFNSLR
jgi:hypothetical protein